MRGPEHHRAFYRARRPQKKKQPVWISLGNNAIKVSEIDQGNASFQSAFADQPSRINLPESTFQNQPSRINLPEPSDSIPGFFDPRLKSDDKQDRADSSLNKKVQSLNDDGEGKI
ncbi:hypothetical protein [Methanothrix soehngenii]|uniref:hypothetical protein n=2 Tax=Methanothrix soehngenii TaxID=2223 RepID=UPI0023554330|nr:hypothetical protein [Methanothrix soehngenii]